MGINNTHKGGEILKITTYSRLSVTTLKPSNTTLYTYLHGRINSTYMKDAGLDRPTMYFIPLDVGGTESEVKDIFEDKVVGSTRGGTKLSSVFHAKLPGFYEFYSEVDLMRAWYQSGGNETFRIEIGQPPPYLHRYRSDYYGGSGLIYKGTANGEVISMPYSISWDNYSWVDPHPRLMIGGRAMKWKVVNGIIYSSSPKKGSIPDEVRQMPIQEVDAEYCNFLARKVLARWLEEEWNDWEKSTNQFVTTLQFPGSYSTGNFPVPTLFNERARLGGYMTAEASFAYDWLVQHAFYEACGEITKMNDNSIQNILEMGKLILSCCTGNVMSFSKLIGELDGMLVKDVAKDAADNLPKAWLAYRYQIGTGIADVNQFSSYLLDKTDQWLNFLNQNYYQRSYGVATRTVDGHAVKCICELMWRPRVVTGLRGIMQQLHEWGLELNAYVLWDFVPLSFVADWVLPIGDYFDVISNAKYLTEEYYDFDYCGFSLNYDMEGEILPGHRYYRWYQEPPVIDGYTWFDDKTHAKTKTWAKRGLDGAALVTGIVKSIH